MLCNDITRQLFVSMRNIVTFIKLRDLVEGHLVTTLLVTFQSKISLPFLTGQPHYSHTMILHDMMPAVD